MESDILAISAFMLMIVLFLEVIILAIRRPRKKFKKNSKDINEIKNHINGDN